MPVDEHSEALTPAHGLNNTAQRVTVNVGAASLTCCMGA
jgi:hypothetical protein